MIQRSNHVKELRTNIYFGFIKVNGSSDDVMSYDVTTWAPGGFPREIPKTRVFHPSGNMKMVFYSSPTDSGRAVSVLNFYKTVGLHTLLQ